MVKHKGNPWHDARGRFCSGPKGRLENEFQSSPHEWGCTRNALNQALASAREQNPSALNGINNVGRTEDIRESYSAEIASAYRETLDTLDENLSDSEKDEMAKTVAEITERQLKRNDKMTATIAEGGSGKIAKVLRKYSGIYLSTRAEKMTPSEVYLQVKETLLQGAR